MTASYLSQIERSIIEPSLSALRKISACLETPLYVFLTDEVDPYVLVKSNERKKLDLPDSSMTYEFLTPMVSDKNTNLKMEIIYFQLEPDSWSSDELLSHPADECIFIMQGEVDVFLFEKKYSMQKGDSIYIQPNVAHRLLNTGKEIAIGISSISPPIY